MSAGCLILYKDGHGAKLQEKKIKITGNGNVTIIPDSDFNGLSKVDITTNIPKYSIANSIEEMNNIKNPDNGQIVIIKGEGTKFIRTPFKIGITTDTLYIDTTKIPSQIVGSIPGVPHFGYSFVGPDGYAEDDFNDLDTIPAHCLLFAYVDSEEEYNPVINVNTTSQSDENETVFSLKTNKWLTDKIVFDTPVTFSKIYATDKSHETFKEFTEDTYLGLSKLFLYDKEIPNYIAAYQYGEDGWSPILLDNLTELVLSLEKEGNFEYTPKQPYSGYRSVTGSVKINNWTKPEGWPDIQHIYEETQKEFSDYYISIYLLDDSVSGITFIDRTPSDVMYRTSDNPNFFESVPIQSTCSYTFTGAGDVDTGLGYKVRWVITRISKSSINFTGGVQCCIRQQNGDILGNGLLWMIAGDCNDFANTILFGGSKTSEANNTLVSLKIDSPIYGFGTNGCAYMQSLESVEFTKEPVSPDFQLSTFNQCKNLKWFNGGDLFNSFGDNCFSGTYNLKGFPIKETVTIGDNCFLDSGYDSPIVLTQTIGSNAFNSSNIPSIKFNIPSEVTLQNSFGNMYKLRDISCVEGFIPNIEKLDLSQGRFTRDVMLAFGTNLGDNTEKTTVIISFGPNNLAKLSDEDKAVFTNKNYSLS